MSDKMWNRAFTIILHVIITSVYGEAYNEMILVKTDPGENVTVLWEVEPSPAYRYRNIEILHGLNDRILNCYQLIYCLELSRDYTHLVTVPNRNIINGNRGVSVTHLGFSLVNVTSVDSGLYKLRAYHFHLTTRQCAMYVFQEPSKPSISRLSRDDDVLLTCLGTSQSVPEEYRNTSQLEYTWFVNSSQHNYLIEGDVIRIIGVQKCNLGSTFYCTSREVNSTMTSRPSDRFILDVDYLEDIRIHSTDMDLDTDEVLFFCSAECNPRCTYEWMDSKRVVLGNQEYVVVQKAQHVGAVMCRAANKLGIIYANASVSQSVDPAFTTITARNQTRPNVDQFESNPSHGVVIALAVLLGLAVGCMVALGAVYMLYRRKHPKPPVTTDIILSTTRIDVLPPPPNDMNNVYENEAFCAGTVDAMQPEATQYDQLGPREHGDTDNATTEAEVTCHQLGPACSTPPNTYEEIRVDIPKIDAEYEV